MKITVVGAGYVGLSLSLLLSQKYKVDVLDIDHNKVDLINQKKSPIKDIDFDKYLIKAVKNLKALTDKSKAYSDSDFIVVATPTDYNELNNEFDTSSVEEVIQESIQYNKSATIIIKSTVPLGFTDRMREKFNYSKIIFSPEFLREGKALYDNLYPARIIVGDKSKSAKSFGNMLSECAKKDDIDILFMSSKEAEAVKLFSNTFLAMRVAYFNELDTFCDIFKLDSKNVIAGVSKDLRIGNYYNNPSFGYGGYCLPKDTKQLLQNFSSVPNNIIKATVESNKTRKEFIAKSILSKNPKIIGIYRLVMKLGSDNFRESAIIDIIDILKKSSIDIILYEPYISEKLFQGIKVESDFIKFSNSSDIIVANRLSDELKSVIHKVYSKDIFQDN